jgi:TonB family protein
MSDSFRTPIPCFAPTLALATLALMAAAVSGCATDDEARRAADEQEKLAGAVRGGQIHEARRQTIDPMPAMKVDNEMGVLETGDVEETLKARFDDVRACYLRAGKAQEYAGGRVLLRFLVSGDGRAQDVWVVESSLGNYSVERCLVEVGRTVVFRAPSGHKATTFEYPVEFRPTSPTTVLDIDGLKIDHDVAAFLPQLAACGPLAREPVVVIIYIEPNGFPGSVGLAAGVALDEDAGDCAVQTIRRWKMSAVLPGRVLRANFSIPRFRPSAPSAPSAANAASPASAELASRKHAVSSASARRRHR